MVKVLVNGPDSKVPSFGLTEGYYKSRFSSAHGAGNLLGQIPSEPQKTHLAHHFFLEGCGKGRLCTSAGSGLPYLHERAFVPCH